MASAILYPRSERISEDICLKCNGSENKLKRGRQKTVTWPIDEKICEVRHFLVDDAPSFLGVAMQELLHCKQQSHTIGSHNLTRIHPHEAKRARFTSVVEPGENLVNVPPGFGHSVANKLREPEVVLEAPMAITVPWHCPDKFNLDGLWLWAGGENSTEVALQEQREIRVFEAVYPRLASVPDSPAEPQERCKDIDTTLVSEIPLIPVEEEEMDSKDVEKKIIESDCTVMPFPEHKETAGVPMRSDDILHSNDMAESVKYRQADFMKVDSNVAAVAAAACMVVKALGESDLVDETLLLAILKNPSLLKSLTCNQVMKDKSQDNIDDIARRVSREPVASSSGKLPTDHGAHLNVSPDSVLTKWGKCESNGNPFGTTSIPSGDTSLWQSGNTNRKSMNPPVAASLPTYDPDNTDYTQRKWMQEGVEIAPQGHKPIPDFSKNIPFNPGNLQELSLAHVYRPIDDSRLLSSVSSQNGLNIDDRQLVQTIATPNPLVSTLSVLATANSSCSVLRTSLSTSKLPRKVPSRVEAPCRRLVQNADISLIPAKQTALGVSGGRAKRFCMYFNSPRGCRNGASCAFVHQSLDSELNAMSQQ